MEEEEWKIQIKQFQTLKWIKIVENKNGKSPGPGNVNLQLIKYSEIRAAALVTKSLNKVLQGDNTTQKMKTVNLK
jgi:hypothetical protein